MTKDKVKKFLIEHEDKENAAFQRRILVTGHYVYGIKTPVLENFAKELVADGVCFEQLPLESFEEVLLAGMWIAHSKLSAKEKVKKLDKLIPYFDNWAHCDMIVARLKKLESEQKYFESLLTREKPFEKRVGIIFLMSKILKTNVKETIKTILSVKDENYYVKMAQAWAMAEAGVYDFDFTYETISTISDKFIRNKAISKMCDSYRITPTQKEKLKKLRI